MSDHSIAFVPLGSSYLQSTDLLARNRPVDTGLLAEALVYYDRILLNVENPQQFSQLISWLIQQGLPADAISNLFYDGILQVCDFAFTTNPYTEFHGETVQIHGLMHFQDQRMARPNSFHERYVEFEPMRKVFESNSQFETFAASLENRVIEIKADDVGAPPIDNAYHDFLRPDRSALMAQEFVNEIFRIKSLGPPPKIAVEVRGVGGGQFQVSWNIPLNLLPAVEVNSNIKAAVTIPLSTAVQANKYLWLANRIRCDLFLARPISTTVGDKLFEVAAKAPESKARVQEIIKELELSVEFPDLRRYVNADIIDFTRVMEIRAKAKKFRDWLQSEADRDRDAIIAYHNEVAKSSGFRNVARRSLKVFGVLSGAAVGASITANPAIGVAVGGIGAAVVEAGAKEAVKYLWDLGADLGAEWRPVVFGKWYSKKISDLLSKEQVGGM